MPELTQRLVDSHTRKAKMLNSRRFVCRALAAAVVSSAFIGGVS
jgi:hypothetical protein